MKSGRGTQTIDAHRREAWSFQDIPESTRCVDGRGERHVFTTTWGGPIYPTTVTALPATLIKTYNGPEDKAQTPAEPLPYVRLHDLRHIHATTLLLAGVPVHIVAARLGHADAAITLRVYAHVIRSAETVAADVFANALNTSEPG